MNSKVKQYDAFDGYGTPLHGKFVRHDDYAALEAECERLRGEVNTLTHETELGLNAYCQVQAERDALRAELAAIKGQGHAGEVHLRKGGGISMLQVELHMPLPPGTKLYALPPAAPDVAGLVEALAAIKSEAEK